MSFDNISWLDPAVFKWFGVSLILNGLVAYLWHIKFYRKLGLKTYQAMQRIHLNETPRLGGLVFILSFVGFVTQGHLDEGTHILKPILISLIPCILVSLNEDLFHNVDSAVRLLSLLFVGWLFRASFMGPLPNLSGVPLLGELVLLQGGISFFYIFSMVAIANGMNFIDGVNGLCGMVTLTILSALLFLSYKTGDTVMLTLIFNTILLVIPFILFNFPYGKIFLGDLGAYSLGLLLSMLTIILFGRHPEISPYTAILILIYPVTEIVFTMLRRLLKGTSVFRADTLHLHLKIFFFLRPQPAYKKIANALVMPILTSLWIFPLLSLSWVYQKPLFILLAIVLFVALYVSLYAMVPNIQKKKKKKN